MSLREDHDQRFKSLIREFFAEFLQLFFANWAERLDLNAVEWLDKEVFPEPPDGSRHLLDLIAKVRTCQRVAELHPDEPDQWLALVHIEIESPDRATRLKPRLPAYYFHLREKYGAPVLPIVLYLKLGLEGIGADFAVEQFWELEVLRFQYSVRRPAGARCCTICRGRQPTWLGSVDPDESAQGPSRFAGWRST